jgi:hypothetical protein
MKLAVRSASGSTLWRGSCAPGSGNDPDDVVGALPAAASGAAGVSLPPDPPDAGRQSPACAADPCRMALLWPVLAAELPMGREPAIGPAIIPDRQARRPGGCARSDRPASRHDLSGHVADAGHRALVQNRSCDGARAHLSLARARLPHTVQTPGRLLAMLIGRSSRSICPYLNFRPGHFR